MKKRKTPIELIHQFKRMIAFSFTGVILHYNTIKTPFSDEKENDQFNTKSQTPYPQRLGRIRSYIAFGQQCRGL